MSGAETLLSRYSTRRGPIRSGGASPGPREAQPPAVLAEVRVERGRAAARLTEPQDEFEVGEHRR
ncbi:hypothetical protein GA0115246_109025, partial [Streptomyces sp. SolWspMP-sol7th]